MSAVVAVPPATAQTAERSFVEHPQQQQQQQQQHHHQSAQRRQQDAEWLMSCRCESARPVSTLLSCLKTTPVLQPVTVFCSRSCLTFHVSGSSKQMQASVEMQASLFSEYRVEASPDAAEAGQAVGEFCVNLTTLLDCLHVLGTQNLERTKVFFSYNLSKEFLKLELLDDSGMLSTATIPGMLPPEDDLGSSLATAFRSSDIAARIIVKSETLRECMQEVELVAGAASGSVSLGASGLEISVAGHSGECLVIMPATGNHVVSLELTDRSNAGEKHSYPLHALLGSMRGLEIANETCISINSHGMMAIQHQVLEEQRCDSAPNFVDCIMCCLEDMEESDAASETETTASQVHERHSSSAMNEGSPSTAGWMASQQSNRRRRVSQEESSSLRSTQQRDESDGDNEDSATPSSSVAPLFGSVMRDVTATTSDATLRVTRRRLQRPSSSRGNSTLNDDGGSVRSRILLDSDNDEDDAELLNTTPASPAAAHCERDDCASPELVYGRQH